MLLLLLLSLLLPLLLLLLLTDFLFIKHSICISYLKATQTGQRQWSPVTHSPQVEDWLSFVHHGIADGTGFVGLQMLDNAHLANCRIDSMLCTHHCYTTHSSYHHCSGQLWPSAGFLTGQISEYEQWLLSMWVWWCNVCPLVAGPPAALWMSNSCHVVGYHNIVQKKLGLLDFSGFCWRDREMSEEDGSCLWGQLEGGLHV